MVTSNSSTNTKSVEKIPAAKIRKAQSSSPDVNVRISPGGSPRTLQEEVASLRARNKVLTDTLKAIKDNAQQEEKRLYDLVWFARNRGRYPNHQSRYRIENSAEYEDELKKLETDEGDYFHGIHAGVLAASRFYKDCADILHINEHQDVSEELLQEAAKHKKKIEASREAFPKVEVDSFPDADKP